MFHCLCSVFLSLSPSSPVLQLFSMVQGTPRSPRHTFICGTERNTIAFFDAQLFSARMRRFSLFSWLCALSVYVWGYVCVHECMGGYEQICMCVCVWVMDGSMYMCTYARLRIVAFIWGGLETYYVYIGF